MKNNTLIYGLVGLLTSSAIAGLLVTNNTQAQSPNSQHNIHHPSQVNSTQKRGMMLHVDQHFIEMMIPHHQQAVEMADLALTSSKRPEIKKLAQVIKKDQNREIQQMQTWYKAWYGKDVPIMAMNSETMMQRHQRMHQGMMDASMHQNMMNMKMDLEALKSASDFDKEFIRQMIPHHKMAVKMSQMVANKGKKPELRQLAQSMIKTQNLEINQMQQWYQAWYNSTPEKS
ncbi:DUF305 domain-containing protein [Calothrix sp. UHCC 0171]|uniref:DUF305 domain-containing protein n=1 Tax=Calothrix sp. UHCC 0171 TaxID=3110245 RepID=UPI002B1FCFDC|nr:DUF305 domain-containing protein [Calothrix sp. UHCC 0171]MEA5572659.1 DUF305 domain-containing protein [Calothrix sp. UHCC 0171]